MLVPCCRLPTPRYRVDRISWHWASRKQFGYLTFALVGLAFIALPLLYYRIRSPFSSPTSQVQREENTLVDASTIDSRTYRRECGVDLVEPQSSFILESRQWHIPDFPDAMNPSLLRWDAQSFLLAFRTRKHVPAGDENDQVGFVWLDLHLNVASPVQLDMFWTMRGWMRSPQDPRLLNVGARKMVVHSNLIPSDAPTHGWRRIFISELTLVSSSEPIASRRLRISDHRPLLDFEAGIRRPYDGQKYWAPFAYRSRLHLVSKIEPLRVVGADDPEKPNAAATVSVTGALQLTTQWTSLWGELLGGTNAIPVIVHGEQRYLALFHSVASIASCQSNGVVLPHYTVGAYTFGAEPPHQLMSISRTPFRSMKLYPSQSVVGSPPDSKTRRVAYPIGLVRVSDHPDENSGLEVGISRHRLLVSYGVQDNEAWVETIDTERLIQSMEELEHRTNQLRSISETKGTNRNAGIAIPALSSVSADAGLASSASSATASATATVSSAPFCRRTPAPPADPSDSAMPAIGSDGVAVRAAGGPLPPFAGVTCPLRMLVAWIGVGGKRIREKVHWIRSNHAQLERTKHAQLHIDYEAYSYMQVGSLDGDTATDGMRLPAGVRVHYAPGVIWSYVIDELHPSRLRLALYDYVLLLLDDISLHPSFDLEEAVKIMQRNDLDVLSPTVAASDCRPWHSYLLPNPTRYPRGRLCNRAEFFLYLMPLESYALYYIRIVTHFPNTRWGWGLDYVLTTHGHLRVGLLDQWPIRHWDASTGENGSHDEPAAEMRRWGPIPTAAEGKELL